MNGAGNDFVVIDARKNQISLSQEQIRNISARNEGNVTRGCDQLIVLEKSEVADVFMRIYNADGVQVDACGNATRCVGWLIMDDKKTTKASIQTKADILHCYDNDILGKTIPLLSNTSGRITADMGIPKFAWQDIP